jgi:hypothetical protein
VTARPSPIFVCGAARSGTTMLGAMLGRHPDCVTVPEATFVADALRRFHPIDEADPRELLRFVVGSPRHRLWESPVDVDAVPEDAIAAGLAEVVRVVVSAYARRHGVDAYRRWVDHTPLSVRHARALFELFPDARMVHIVRDGRAVAASVLPLDWGPGNADAAARTWIESLAHGLAAEALLGPERIRRVRYEDVVLRPETTLRELAEWLGIGYVDAIGNGDGGLELPRHTREQHRLVGGAPDASRIEAWRTTLTGRQIEIYESVAAPMLLHMGYEPVHGLGARRRTRAERRADVLGGLWRSEVTDRWRRHRRWRR